MKTQNLLKSIFGVAIIATLLPIISCDSAHPSAFVGRWVGVSGSNKGGVVDLLSDGTGVVTEGSNGVAITWKTENGRFYTTTSQGAVSWSYKLQGSMITFTDDNGEIAKYTKCNKDCQETAKEYIAAALKAVEKGSFTDSRDSKTYKTLKLDDKTWMAENLNYEAEGSKCYEDQEGNCQKYGRLYNWSTAKSACPESWHLPSNDEWHRLVNFVGDDNIAGNVLKASSGWENDGNGTGDIGFSALPGGYASNFFFGVGNYGYWWSSTEINASKAYSRYIGKSVGSSKDTKGTLFSVRCVRN